MMSWRTVTARCLPMSLLVAVCLMTAACDPPSSAPPSEQPTTAAPEPLGAPRDGMPGTLEELLAQGGEVARSWQSGARVSELFIELDEGRDWAGAQLTYLGPGADRMLVVTITPEGTGQERPTLATLGLSAVSPEGLGEVPAPDGLAEPDALIEAAAGVLESCGASGGPSGLLYATGAPISWDAGAGAWSAPPVWTATVFASGAGGAALDPSSGAPVGDGCVD
ncbi:MAG TPA: hypothetical protein VML96_05090 [Egibacteraceae bacterium]|nr:hypothetical protein [Egibacteraceae bacterium]